MERIEAILGCLAAVCLIVFIVEYSPWLVLGLTASLAICGIAEAIKWIWRKLTKKEG
ncbi:MAG: hypothetical protein IJX12_07850 [Lachnospiraceae bacterium]|nr:hypothetical protein [Lachnospiraceae bacterium]